MKTYWHLSLNHHFHLILFNFLMSAPKLKRYLNAKACVSVLEE